MKKVFIILLFACLGAYVSASPPPPDVGKATIQKEISTTDCAEEMQFTMPQVINLVPAADFTCSYGEVWPPGKAVIAEWDSPVAVNDIHRQWCAEPSKNYVKNHLQKENVFPVNGYGLMYCYGNP